MPAPWEITDADLARNGGTSNLPQRIETLRAHSPVPLEIVYAVKGDYWLEQQIHRCFEAHRVHHEWFDLPDGWLSIVATICSVSANNDADLIRKLATSLADRLATAPGEEGSEG